MTDTQKTAVLSQNFNIRLSINLKAKLRIAAEEEGFGVGEYIRTVMENWIDRGHELPKTPLMDVVDAGTINRLLRGGDDLAQRKGEPR